MVASNPLFSGGMSIKKKFMATVINDIWPEVIFFSLVATMVTSVSEKTSHKLELETTLLTVLGTVLGLVISFRTSSAYERYQDGRKLWTSIMTLSRNLAMTIWIHVPNERPAKPGQKVQTVLDSVIEKKSMINLVQAFSVSVKEGTIHQGLCQSSQMLHRTICKGSQKHGRVSIVNDPSSKQTGCPRDLDAGDFACVSELIKAHPMYLDEIQAKLESV